MRYLLATARPIAEDMAGTLTFYLLYVVTGSAALGAGVGLALGLGQIVRHRMRREAVPALLLLGVALTVVLSALSLVAHDPRLLLVKPSIAYAVIGCTMLPRGWVIRYVPAIATELLPMRAFDRIGWSWAALMFATAALNLGLVAMLPPRTAAVTFLVWSVASKAALFGTQYAIYRARAGRAYRLRQS